VIKVVAAFRRNPERSMEEFSAYYFEHHPALFRSETPPEVMAGVSHYVQNHARPLGAGDPPFDCVTEIGFTGMDALHAWNAWYFGEGGRALRDDEDHFMDKGSRVIVVTDERVPVGFPQPAH